MNSFDTVVGQMKNLAHRLVSYSFPLVSPQDEEEVSCLKQREIVIDGYHIIVYFNRCQYRKDIYMESLQVFGKYHVFLPFSVVCKIAYKYLGNQELSLIDEVMHHRFDGIIDEFCRKIYVWTVYYDDNNKPIANPFVRKVKSCSYEGLNYSYVEKDKITFF